MQQQGNDVEGIVRRVLLTLAISVPLSSGCNQITGNERDPFFGPCPQTYEFGNYGCARFVVHVTPPAGDLPPLYRVDVRARWIDSARTTATLPGNRGNGPPFRPTRLTITLWGPGFVQSGDTASVWVIGRILEDVRPIQVGVPLPVFAADSVLHKARFAGVGAVPPVDTIRLTLKR